MGKKKKELSDSPVGAEAAGACADGVGAVKAEWWRSAWPTEGALRGEPGGGFIPGPPVGLLRPDEMWFGEPICLGEWCGVEADCGGVTVWLGGM